MSQEPAAAFLLDLSSQLFRPTGWSLGFGPRSLFLAHKLKMFTGPQVQQEGCWLLTHPPNPPHLGGLKPYHSDTSHTPLP